MITVITSPKPFIDTLIRTIQYNALRNWRALGLEVLLFGDEEGTAEAARAVGARWIPHIQRNAHGTPLLSSMVEQAREQARTPWLLLANADILFTPCLLRAAQALERLRRRGPLLATGRRWDVDIRHSLSFSGTWAPALHAWVREQGRMNLTGMDFFLFPRELPLKMPALAIGRAGWDNWMIYHARQRGWPVVDVTADVLAVHQNHHYHHLGGRPHYKTPESLENVRLAGGPACMFTLWEATHLLVEGRLRPAPWHPMKPLRKLELWLLQGGFPEHGWKRVALRVVRRKLQAALFRHPLWWLAYYGGQGCALASIQPKV